MTEKEELEMLRGKLAMLKAKQAAAHKKWSQSEKGKAYYQKKKERKALETV